ncbi:MAG: hypothetical protein RIQ52_1886 [Pseudomonadota bacterium]|jgi:cell division septation protein DedD
MDEALKQRLIGIGIVVIFAILFVPLLFDKSPEKSRDSGLNALPPMPQELHEKPIALPAGTQDAARSPENVEAGNRKGAKGNGGYKIIPILDEPVSHEASQASEAAQPARQEPSPATTAGAAAPVTRKPGMAASQVISDDVAEDEFPPAAPPVSPASRQGTPSRDAVVAPAISGKPPAAPRSSRSPSVPAPVSGQTDTPAAPLTGTVKPGLNASARKSESVAIIAPAAGKKGDTARKNSAESSAAQPLWVVQLGSFNSEANARILVEKLRQAHFSTHIETMTTGSGAMMYRVQTAPEMDRRRADETLKKMESSSGVHGIVLPHP